MKVYRTSDDQFIGNHSLFATSTGVLYHDAEHTIPVKDAEMMPMFNAGPVVVHASDVANLMVYAAVDSSANVVYFKGVGNTKYSTVALNT